MVQDLWQLPYQILLIISQKKLRNVRKVEICDSFLESESFKNISITHKCLFCNKIYIVVKKRCLSSGVHG